MTKASTKSVRTARLLPLAAALVLAGCGTLAPDYVRPELPLADQLQAQPGAQADGLSTQAAAQVPWQAFIKDERLQQLIQLALSSNRSLRETLADVEAARATYRIQRADLFPEIDAGLSGTRSKASGEITNAYEAEAGLSSYEIDLFGKNRSLTEAEMETWLAAEETARAAQITLIGEVASAWLTLAADRNLLTLAEETAESAKSTLAITRKRVELGVDSRVDLADAETIYHSARVDVASYQTQTDQDINALRLLVGEELDESLLPDALPESEQLVSVVPAGLSSTVLLQRPDVLAAEHNLKAANANIGAARAAYFPTLSLTATGGVASSVLADVLTGGASSIWSIAPSLTLPIFDAGANDASLAYSQAQREKYLAAYEYAIQSAFSEVADALARRATIQNQLDAQQALVDASARSYELSFARYQRGVDSFQDALEAQRTLYSAQQTLITTRQTDLENRITLYRVLGGGLADSAGESAEESTGEPG